MQLGSVRHMIGHKVVVTGQGAREFVLGGLWRELGQAHDGRNVFFSLVDRKVGPFSTHSCVGEGAVVVGARGNLLGQIGLDLGPCRELNLVDDIESIRGIALAVVLVNKRGLTENASSRIPTL